MKESSIIYFFKLTLLLLFSIFSFSSSGQSKTEADFREKFSRIATTGFTKTKIKALIEEHFSDYTFKDSAEVKYPLSELKSTQNYKLNINKLLNDTSSVYNRLAYLLIINSHDTMRIKDIEVKIAKSAYTDFDGAIALATLEPQSYIPILTTIQNVNAFQGSLLSAALLNQEPEMVEKIGFDNITSKINSFKYFAIAALAKGGYSPAKEKALKGLVISRDSLFGLAIAALSGMKSPDMADIVREHVNDARYRLVSLTALANSSSQGDNNFIDSLVEHNHISKDLILALNNSTQTDSQKKLLTILASRELNLEFPIYPSKAIIENDSLYLDIIKAVKTTNYPENTNLLLTYFHSRKDEKTTKLLVNWLAEKTISFDITSRLVDLLYKRNSTIIEQALPKLFKDATIDQVAILKLLIEYSNYSFQDQVREWDISNVDWEHAYLVLHQEYLSHIKN